MIDWIPYPLYCRLAQIRFWWGRVWCAILNHPLVLRKENLFGIEEAFYSRCFKCDRMDRLQTEWDLFAGTNCRGNYL